MDAEVGRIQRAVRPTAHEGSMADVEKELQDLKREVIESRNLVIKTDNLLKNLHAELRSVREKHEAFEKRSYATGATALILFAALSAVGAYVWARAEIRGVGEDLREARAARQSADSALAEARAREQESRAESDKALALYDRLSDKDTHRRGAALEEVAQSPLKGLTTLEQRALKDRARSLREAAAVEAYETGKTALRRNEFRAAAEQLARYIALEEKPEDMAYLLLGQARYGMKAWKEAVEPLQTFLREMPNSKSGDYATLILGESLAASGDSAGAIEVYRNGADRYPASQFAPAFRSRAARLRREMSGQPPAAAQPAAAQPPAAAPAPAAQPAAAVPQ